MNFLKPKFWNKKSLFSYLLLPISFFIQALSKIFKLFIKKKKFDLPIICVGNIYIGGTGKTPLAIEMASILKLNKKNPVILKKSYKKHLDEFNLIENKKINLIKSKSRDTGIIKAINKGYDVVILDDGFQDSSIHKDLNILCFNEKQLAGNEMTLPSGPLRNSLKSIKDSQIIVINGNANEEFENKIKNISNEVSIFYSKYTPLNLEDFKNKKILAFAGIGNPDNFFDLLEQNNINLVKKFPFPDHYNYSLKELKELINYADENNLDIITTEKDYFRIIHFQLSKIKYLSIKIDIFEKHKFINKIISYI